MSVVNQMLRDLDARRGAAPGAVLDDGIAPVVPRPVRAAWPGRSTAAIAAVAALGAGVLATGGFASAEAPARVALAIPVVAAPVAAPAPLPLPAPVSAVRETRPPEPVRPLSPASVSRPIPPVVTARPTRVALAVPVARAAAPKAAVASAPTVPASAITPAAAAAPMPQKQFALVDRVQAARELAGSGQSDAALALLREALATPGADAAGRATAARELARLELLARDPAGALQTLDRHMAELRGDAQAWALRGNAAQRLGRHDDAVAAFESAVRLQGDDARSMLGAAVSLAAAGNTERARSWADRARRSGSVPADVLAYLNRLGVVVEP